MNFKKFNEKENNVLIQKFIFLLKKLVKLKSSQTF